MKEKACLPYEEHTEGRLVVEDIQVKPVMVMRGGEWGSQINWLEGMGTLVHSTYQVNLTEDGKDC